jgi:hypothetical protein
MSEGLQRVEHNNESSSEAKIASKPAKKKRGCFFRVISVLFFSLIAFLILLAIFIQTQWFRNIALDQGLKYVNGNLVKPGSMIYAARLEGNLRSEIYLLNAGIVVKNDTLLKLDTIHINYSLFPIFNNQINVSLIELINPTILFTQVKNEDDSLRWNYTQIFKSQPDTAIIDTAGFDWDISLEKLILKNGNFSSISNLPSNTIFSQLAFKNTDSLNVDYLQLREINWELGAEYTPEYKMVDIKTINFKSNSYFNLYELSGKAEFKTDENISEITNFKIITDSSSIVINHLRMEDYNPFGETIYENFDSNEVVIDMVADNFYAKDLLYFLPQLNFLSGKVHLELVASGNYGDILIDKLILNTPFSHYDFKGKIQNLHEPSKLYFNITGRDLIIDPRDTKYIIPGLTVPDYAYLGVVRAPYITYVGEPTRFNSDFDIRTEVGNINGNTYLDLTQNQIVYRTDFQATSLNLGKFLRDPKLESNVNLTVKGEGRGFDLQTMVANLNYDIKNSRILNTNISASAGQINLNNGVANVDFYFNSNTLKSKAKGQVNIRNLENPSYDLKGDVANLDISTFTGDQSMKSNLTFAFDLKGSGIKPDDLNGNFDIKMQQSTFGEYFIPPADLVANISKSGGETSIDLKSDFADITAKGRFDFMDLGTIVSNNIDKLTYELQKYALSKDTSGSTTMSTTLSSPVVTSTPDANLTYKIVLKDLTPVAYLYDTSFNVKGTIEGTLLNSNNTLTMTANGDFSNFALKDTSIYFYRPKLKFDFTNNPTNPELTNFTSNLNVVADSIRYITSDSSGVTKFIVDSLYTDFKFVNYTNNYDIFGRSDTLYVLNTKGSLDILPGGYATNTDLLYVKINEYRLHNNNKFTVAYIENDTDKFISFKDFEISTGKWISSTATVGNQKNVSIETNNSLNDTNVLIADAETWISDNQRLGLEGYYSLEKNSNIQISANNIKMTTIQKFMDPLTRPENLIGGGIRRVEILYTGQLSDPKFYMEVNSDPLIMRRKILGRFDAILEYDSTNLKTDIAFYNDRNLGNLLIKGNLPILIVLDGDTTRAQDTVFVNRQVDLNVEANHFKIDVLSPFIPLVSSLSGSLNGDVKVSGVSDNPLLTGGLNLDSTQFVFNMTRNTYALKADFKTEGQKLILTYSKMNSIFEPSQFMETKGFIDFTNLKLNNMEFVMGGTLQAFDKSTGMSKFGIGGNLIVGSRENNNPIKITGNADELVLSGNVILVDGNVTMNPVTGKEYDIYNDDFIYGVLIDSSSFGDTLEQYLVYEINKWSQKDYSSLNPFERIFVPVDSSQINNNGSSSKFIYDIKLLTDPGKYIYLNFIVNEQTKNEFFGEVAVDLAMNNRAGDDNVYAKGNVTLGPAAYYRFYRNFDASGDITFEGELTDPKLDILAEFTTSSTNPNDPSAIDEYKVEMKVTGTAKDLNPINFTVYKNGASIGGSDPTSDAISVILFGRTQISGAERSSLVSNLGLNVGTMFVSDYVGNLLQNILPFIKTAGLNYEDSQTGSVVQNTSLNLTAQFGDAVVRFGGTVFEDVSNTNVIVTYPIGKLISSKIGTNLVLQIERIYNINGGNTILNPKERVGISLQYKIKF